MPTGLTQLQKRQLNLGHADTLIPIPEDPPGNQVIIVGGSYLNDETLQLEQLATQASPSFSPVAPGQERWDLVYVDTSNVIQKSVGTPQALGGSEFAGAPTPPEWAIPLAYVHVTETGTVVVEQEDITDIRPFLRQPNHRDQSGKAATFHDSPQMDHDKAVPSDWDSPTTPQPVDVLLDELAERITDQTLLQLTDTPGSYGGQALSVLRVNAGETGIEFASASSIPDHVRLHPVFGAVDVDVTPSGHQTDQVTIAKPGSVLGSDSPPLWVDLTMVVYASDSFGSGPVGRLKARVYSYIDGSGNLKWWTVFEPPEVAVGGIYSPTDWVYGASGSGTLLADDFWSIPNPVDRGSLAYGRYYHETTSTPVGTPLKVQVFQIEEQLGSDESYDIEFTWDQSTQELTVDLRHDITNLEVQMTLWFEDLRS